MICLKIRTFVVSATTQCNRRILNEWLWFAWKFVPLWYQQQQKIRPHFFSCRCDLLENSYLCGISNNLTPAFKRESSVVICLKIRTFVVSATTSSITSSTERRLWFAWKFVPLWYQQQLWVVYLLVDICCDLLENSYLCGISNNLSMFYRLERSVVICLKIRTFVVSATTVLKYSHPLVALWFAWKFVPLWYQQQLMSKYLSPRLCCDLLENSYLCGISNNLICPTRCRRLVVICLKIRTFVVSATTEHHR